MMQLYIGNKNYSSWSMRPWVLMKQAGIAFDEVMVRFDAFTPDSHFKTTIAKLNPAAKVPVLVDGTQVVWDTLAIAETLAEKYPEKHLWPANPGDRARARSLCAEMHSGFSALRNACPMNIEARLPEVGTILWRDNAGLRADVARLITMWQSQLQASGGPLLFGAFSIADAYYAPVCTRLQTYALPVPDDIRAYVEQVCVLPGIRAWVEGALAEQDFLDFEEPYRLRR